MSSQPNSKDSRNDQQKLFPIRPDQQYCPSTREVARRGHQTHNTSTRNPDEVDTRGYWHRTPLRVRRSFWESTRRWSWPDEVGKKSHRTYVWQRSTSLSVSGSCLLRGPQFSEAEPRDVTVTLGTCSVSVRTEVNERGGPLSPSRGEDPTRHETVVTRSWNLSSLTVRNEIVSTLKPDWGVGQSQKFYT